MPRAASLLLLLVAAGCIPGPHPYDGPSIEDLAPDAFVGCYDATFHDVVEWRADNRWRFRLYSEAANSSKPGGGGGLPDRRATASIQESDDPYWRLIPTGVQMYIGDSLHGVYFDFTPTAQGLAGRAFHHSDTRDGFVTERVSARRVECTD
jgi:hypothetical protein